VLKGIIAFGLTRRTIVLVGLLVFVASGIIAFLKLNIEAYPNPAPVILEITAQAAGLSAEEMEKYYTIPNPTPGIANVRSTSFYGLSFVRVTFITISPTPRRRSIFCRMSPFRVPRSRKSNNRVLSARSIATRSSALSISD